MNINHNTEYTTAFSLSAETASKMEIYKYLKWDSNYFLQCWESNIGTYAAGTIRRYNHIYHVVFMHSLNIGSLKQLRDAGDSIQLALSFRKAKGMPAYVLVSAKI